MYIMAIQPIKLPVKAVETSINMVMITAGYPVVV